MTLSVAKTLLLLGVVGGAAAAQQYVPPPPPLTTAPCVPTKKEPCVAATAAPQGKTEKFPFPGEVPNSSAAPTAAAPEKFPFPGEAPASAPAEGAKPQSQFEDSKSSSSSSPSGDSEFAFDEEEDDDAKTTEAPKGSSRFVRKHLPKVEDKELREAQDLEISRYYASTGDFNAAYLRAKDAVASVAEDPEAHFLLAGAAAKMKKNEEARAEYKTYLTLDPDGDHIKAARLGLKELDSK